MLDPQTTAFVFPGQGSQSVGMGQALAQSSPAARATFEAADAALGFALSQLCWAGPEEVLNDTVNTQPALLTASVAALRALHEQIGDYAPRLVAGHSLGELSALVAAGAMEFEEGLLLVRRRGELMKAAGERAPGGMAAILGMDAPALAEVCAEAGAATGGLVQVANDNCPGQVVISGELAALEAAMELCKARGAKRARRLPVSIAAHSPLMQIVVAEFQLAVDAVPFISPVPELVANVSAAPLSDPNAIRAELPAQLTSPVRWTETIRYMVAAGITTFVEVGPKDVLHGLLKRIDPSVTGLTMGTPEEVAAIAAR
ncbi:MAG: ACP S-malonyltransferase [Anaerolineales bacterium]|nr:ACP S-malonyltransferase [Anaerolineales bacterium]